VIERCWTCHADHDPDAACPQPAAPAPRPARPYAPEAPGPVVARYPGWCADCGARIAAGDLIRPDEGEGWVCARHEEES
jgi:hypothetical protein